MLLELTATEDMGINFKSLGKYDLPQSMRFGKICRIFFFALLCCGLAPKFVLLQNLGYNNHRESE